jgi:hypothetical protein
MAISSEATIIIGFVVLLAIIAINTILIMVIWNNVLVPKVKGAQFQKLGFWDALAIGVFFALISGGTTVVTQSQKAV